MDKEKFDKAVEIQRKIDWLERDVEGCMTLPEKVDSSIAASAVITSLWRVYEGEISEFCENLVNRYRKERAERVAQLKVEFEAL